MFNIIDKMKKDLLNHYSKQGKSGKRKAGQEGTERRCRYAAGNK